jgi:hypothetical protein
VVESVLRKVAEAVAGDSAGAPAAGATALANGTTDWIIGDAQSVGVVIPITVLPPPCSLTGVGTLFTCAWSAVVAGLIVKWSALMSCRDSRSSI